MEKHKQLLTDISVVLGIPIVIVLAYHFYFSTPIPDTSLLSIDSSSLSATPGSADIGSQTKEILNTLNSINFDTTFFSDPAFLSLQDFTPVYVATATGRPYPFTTPEDVQILIDKTSQQATSTTNTTVTKSASTKTTSKK
jgi:hypothetical protein